MTSTERHLEPLAAAAVAAVALAGLLILDGWGVRAVGIVAVTLVALLV